MGVVIILALKLRWESNHILTHIFIILYVGDVCKF
jgi:hypothetical protein